MDVKLWSDLKLSDGVEATIKELGFTHLTPVQAASIPQFLARKDVAVEAVTGSGKTLSFLVPMFEILLKYAPFKKTEVGAIVISPTRELAAQTAEIVELFVKHMPQFTSILLIGGNSVAADIATILDKGANILIATPGRLADLFSQNETLKLASCVKSLEVLILDEADKLLEMGFEKTINTILGFLPKQRLTGLFSATQTRETEDLMRAGLRNPVCVRVQEKGTQKTPALLASSYMVCDADMKLNVLLQFLRSKSHCKCMVFFSTCAGVDYFTAVIREFIRDTPLISIHGKMKKKRHKIFSDFKNYENGILLCTDVMARGVDIPDVHWVVQFDPPSTASSFVHRCGRTARIGKTGNALIMLLPNEDTFINFLNVNQKVTLDKMAAPEASDIIPDLKKIASRNRDVYEKGMRAFVSFIRFYTKHECNLLFRIKDLDIGKLANGYGLIKLPRMPELRKKTPPDFQAMDIQFEDIPYLDKHREKQRKVKLQEFKDNPESRKKMSAKREEYLRSKKLRKLEAKKQKKRKQLTGFRYSQRDLEELERDARLVKKFKKGKISKEEFDAEFITEMEEG